MVMPVNARREGLFENLNKVALFGNVPDELFVLVREVGVEDFVLAPDRIGLQVHAEDGEAVLDVHHVVELVDIDACDLDFIAGFAGVDVVAQQDHLNAPWYPIIK